MSGYRLILLRHGQSEWNVAGRFTGWVNAELTGDGEKEAERAGSLLAVHDLLPAFAHTSLQRRTIRTADLALAAADRDWITVRRSWRLNGRHYGAWPNPCATSPPGCCRTGTTRSSLTCGPGGTVLVISHGNTLRALVKHLDAIPDDQIAELDIPADLHWSTGSGPACAR
jgi:2,3-bisphosphoglycerate-dependent phosphoglycerate mutase